MKGRVGIIRTGGTFDQVLRETETIGVPKSRTELKDLQCIVKDIASIDEFFLELSDFEHVQDKFEGKRLYNLIDSSNMQPEYWVEIAKLCNRLIEEYDGVVILHGTDTLAYTASALSFALQGLGKPIVVTGSQTTLVDRKGKIRCEGDAIRNLRSAVATVLEDLSGVYVVFNEKIMLGTRVSKIRSKNVDAFGSINCRVVGQVRNNSITLPFARERRKEAKSDLFISVEPNIILLKLIPGINANIFDTFDVLGYRGVIVEAYGVGGIPTSVKLNRKKDADIFAGVPFKKNTEWSLKEKIEEWVSKGKSVVIKSQCLYEGVEPAVYDVGDVLRNPKVICAYDMTTEVSVTKLMWVMRQCNDAQNIKKGMLTPIWYEVNPELFSDQDRKMIGEIKEGKYNKLFDPPSRNCEDDRQR